MTAARTQATLTALYRGYAHSVLRRAERMLGTRADAEDVLQDLFTRWQQRPAELEAMREPAAFIYSATTNACLNRLRDGKTRRRLLADRTPIDAAADAPLGEARVLLREALALLPAELQTIAVYYYLDEMTQEEIAEVAGCARRTVSDHLARIQRTLGKERKQ